MKLTRVYTYEELDAEAKEKARLDFMENYPDYEWYYYDYEFFQEKHPEIAINTNETAFDLEYNYVRLHGKFIGGVNLLKECFPEMKDRNMKVLKAALVDFDVDKTAAYFEGLKCENLQANFDYVAEILGIGYESVRAGIYNQSKSGPLPGELAEWIDTKLNDFADYLTKKWRALNEELLDILQEDWDYLTSEEKISEILIGNEYYFFKDGTVLL